MCSTINEGDAQLGIHVPRRLLLQWHVTERCNLRCSHCYQNSYAGEELGFSDLLDILEQYRDLLNTWRGRNGRPPVRGLVTLTGGEPFLREDFVDLLEVLASNKEEFSFAILTNGSLIDAAMARKLRELEPAFVQVSIEGGEHTHNSIRGSGEYARAVSALKHLGRNGLRTNISFTAHRANFQEFAAVADLGRKLDVSRVWADRLIPWGSGTHMGNQRLTPDQTCEFLELMYREQSRTAGRWFGRTKVAMHRALQFLVAGGHPYHCAAGDTLVTIQANGDLYPCRRMPISVGNVMDTPLSELYYESGLFKKLRDKDYTSEGCHGCVYSPTCRGGLKCLSYAVSGSPFNADPGCWLAS